MSFTIKCKKPIYTQAETSSKILTIALELGKYEQVFELMKRYEVLSFKYPDVGSRESLAANLLQELSAIDLKLIVWLFDDNNEIRVNDKLVMKLVDE